MRKLLVTRGIPGSGKTHALAVLGLTDFTLSADAFRLMASSPVMTASGRMAINPANDYAVWTQLLGVLDKRMARGETVVVDATHPTADTFKDYLRFGNEHRYTVGCLDFSEVPLEVAYSRNHGRHNHRSVPAHAMDSIAGRMLSGKVPEGVKRFMVGADGVPPAEFQTWLDVPVLDLTSYEAVLHVGDIQGCATALRTLMKDGIRDDVFHIFIGDACDRGDENGEVIRWLLDNAIGRPNVKFLWGNHEDHLAREAAGLDPVSGEFADSTLPQLREAGITREDLGRFCDALDDMVLYRKAGRSVMVTHAGLASVPEHPWMLPSWQCARGTGHYEDDVDNQFERNAPPGWFQVHGHRNHHHSPTRATSRSFNLEASVEAGGALRGLLLDDDGFHPLEAANPVFRPFRSRRHHRMTIVPAWMKPGVPSALTMAPELRAAMAAHKGVREHASVTMPHIASLNFTKAVFYDGTWDSVTVKARGLFINTMTDEIVARSYPKFMNLGENPEHSVEALADRLVFPITGYVKENGFLGIVGYDRETDSLIVTSKSRLDGEFAGWAREILEQAIPSVERREALKRFLRDCEASIPMEVIDPVRDPHIIEYDVAKVVLLDVVRRSTDFERMPYEGLFRVGKEFGVEVKQRSFTLKDRAAFMGWCARSGGDMSRITEGFVLEDATGFQFKRKAPFYDFWKLCRGMKDAIVREREGGKPARGLDPQFLATRGLGFAAPLADEVRDWMREQDLVTLKQRGIIEVRRVFERSRGLGDEPKADAGCPGAKP